MSYNEFRPDPKPEKKFKEPYTGIKKKFPKPTGEGKMFLTIWSERPHYCTNQKCKEYLGEEPLAHFFAHLKSKGAHSEARFDKKNITLLCFDCHFIYDNGKRETIILPTI